MRHIALPTPLRPSAGAMYSTRQHPSGFNTQTGLTNNFGGGLFAAQAVINSATAQHLQIGFELADLPQSTTFASLFDQYRIEKVLLRFKARNNAVAVFNTASPNGAVPTAAVVKDLDDASALTSLTQYLEYDSMESFSGEEDMVVEIDPSVTPAVYAGGAFSGYAIEQSSKLWLDIANTSIPHYGVKIGLGGLTATTTSSWVWDITAEYIVSFRNTR